MSMLVNKCSGIFGVLAIFSGIHNPATAAV